MTFFPFFARRRAAIGTSRPVLSDTPRRVQTSMTSRVCHCISASSAHYEGQVSSVMQGHTSYIFSSLYLDATFLCICNVKTKEEFQRHWGS